MLTLKAPIEIKSRRDFVHDNESFYDRISANYSFLGREIGAEELLHIVNTPPDVYISEGDLTTVSGSTVINSRNEEKLEIINNVLNRIVVSADTYLSYQDRTYITDVLYKLGIRDDRKFMSEVRRIMNSTLEEDRLINSYLFGDSIREGNEINNELLSLVNRVTNLEREDENLFLSKSIMNRLKTGAIYQIVSNFNRSVYPNSLNISEFAITEQADTAKSILTDRIRDHYTKEAAELIYAETGRETEPEEVSEEEGRREAPPTVYNTVNAGSVYERELLSENRTDINITEELSSALFLDIVKNLISSTFEKNIQGKHEWIDFTNVLFRSSDNLFSRIEQISEESRVFGDRTVNEFTTASADITFRDTAEEIIQEFRNSEYERDEFRNYEANLNRTENRYEESFYAGDINRTEFTEENAEITYPVTLEEEEREIRESETRAFERELIKLNEKNLENVDRYRQMMTLIRNFERDRVTRSEGGAEKTRKEALKALKGNEEILEMFNEEETDEEERRDRLFSEIVRIFPDSSGEIFRIIEQYRENPEIMQQNVNVINNNLQEAAEEIRRIQEREAETPEIEEEITDTRQENLIFRENVTVDMEEIRDNLEEIRRSNRTRIDRRQENEVTEERVTERHNVINTNNTSFTNEEIMDIEEMVDRGVRSRMSAISESVMNKLEKRLRNEKSRRGV